MYFLPILFLFGLGTIVGSFLNVLILRLPTGQTLYGRSHCPGCGHVLAARDLVPLFSFISLRGKCRYCRQPISRRYFYIEFLTGLLFVLAYLAGGYDQYFGAAGAIASAAQLLALLRVFFITSVLVAVFMIDYEHYLILDALIIPVTVLLFVINIGMDYFMASTWQNSYAIIGLASGLGLFLFFFCLYFFSGGRWMGFGDAKLGWFLGLATPAPAIFVNFFLAFMLGAVVSLVLLALRAKHLKSELPFGTFLSVATLATVFYGDRILASYLQLVGWR